MNPRLPACLMAILLCAGATSAFSQDAGQPRPQVQHRLRQVERPPALRSFPDPELPACFVNAAEREALVDQMVAEFKAVNAEATNLSIYISHTQSDVQQASFDGDAGLANTLGGYVNHAQNNLDDLLLLKIDLEEAIHDAYSVPYCVGKPARKDTYIGYSYNPVTETYVDITDHDDGTYTVDVAGPHGERFSLDRPHGKWTDDGHGGRKSSTPPLKLEDRGSDTGTSSGASDKTVQSADTSEEHSSRPSSVRQTETRSGDVFTGGKDNVRMASGPAKSSLLAPKGEGGFLTRLTKLGSGDQAPTKAGKIGGGFSSILGRSQFAKRFR